MKITKTQLRNLIKEAIPKKSFSGKPISASTIDSLEQTATELAPVAGGPSFTGTKNINITGNLRITRVVKSNDQLRRSRTSYHKWEELSSSEKEVVNSKSAAAGLGQFLGWIVNVLLVNDATIPGLPDVAPDPYKSVLFQRGIVYYVPTQKGGFAPSNVYYQIDGLDGDQQRAVLNVINRNPEEMRTESYKGQNDTSGKERGSSGSYSADVETTGEKPTIPGSSDIPGAVERLKKIDKLSPGSLKLMVPNIRYAAEKGVIPGSIKSQFPGFSKEDFVSLLAMLNV